MYQTILAALENGIFIITINRPDKLNALSKAVFTDLNTALDEINSNADIKSVIITGAGPKAFVAGADLSEFGGLNKLSNSICFRVKQLLRDMLKNTR
jgi:enoyl-CoA hydratase